ncbi:isocitrate lyase/PEP mutase family protein [Arvimicrobium flavum]|uniref:isocitrate lyase/PEP mutase family protein n=1 Tax=Arvimicrobium flavum TaxID=3393320 RepID=UPI00237AAA08|nr:isocitrate lyase/PEP mutase family protein [Mesorhizobium shangrilense]
MASLRQMIANKEFVLAPGAYDCLTAGAAQRAGFNAVYMTGAGVSASHGYPDFGLITMTEMVTVAGRMAASVDVPLIADADSGFGSELNTARAVRAYERAGVAAIHIEDQTFPKKCGHFENKTIVPAEDFVAKIRTACKARETPDFMIIARTDARAVEGFNAAIERGKRAADAGADIIFVEAPQTLEEMAAVPERIGAPCLLNVVWRGKTPEIDFETAAELGYSIVILPSILLKSVMGMSMEILNAAKTIGRHPVPPGDIGIKEGVAIASGAEWRTINAALDVPLA